MHDHVKQAEGRKEMEGCGTRRRRRRVVSCDDLVNSAGLHCAQLFPLLPSSFLSIEVISRFLHIQAGWF